VIPLLPAPRPFAGNIALCNTIVTRHALGRGQQWFGVGYHMIYWPASHVVTFARLYSYDHCNVKIRAFLHQSTYSFPMCLGNQLGIDTHM
jgi:hypothetical protein